MTKCAQYIKLRELVLKEKDFETDSKRCGVKKQEFQHPLRERALSWGTA